MRHDDITTIRKPMSGRGGGGNSTSSWSWYSWQGFLAICAIGGLILGIVATIIAVRLTQQQPSVSAQLLTLEKSYVTTFKSDSTWVQVKGFDTATTLAATGFPENGVIQYLGGNPAAVFVSVSLAYSVNGSSCDLMFAVFKNGATNAQDPVIALNEQVSSGAAQFVSFLSANNLQPKDEVALYVSSDNCNATITVAENSGAIVMWV